MPERSSAGQKTPRPKTTARPSKAATGKPATVEAEASPGAQPEETTPKKAASPRARADAAADNFETTERPARSRARRAKQPAESTAEEPQTAHPERERLIAIAAYYIAERRGFAPGGELDDWLQAEQAIEQLIRSRAG